MADKDPETRERALALATQFGDSRALVNLRERLMLSSEPATARLRALEAIVTARDAASLPAIVALAKSDSTESALRGAAVRALAAFDSPEVPGVLLGAWKNLPAGMRRDALSTLASRPAWGLRLMDAVAKGEVASADIPAETEIGRAHV